MRRKKSDEELYGEQYDDGQYGGNQYADAPYDDSYDVKYDPRYDISAGDGADGEILPQTDEEYAQYLEETEEDEKERRVGRLKIAAGVADFVSVVLGIVTIIIFMAILLSLYNWLSGDIAGILGGFAGAMQ
ncbi:MAG: hypothetical protein PHI27_03990 [Eubacteriales bacterium]|nr:hypothetical protein [Eubacteriales bacterium]MDD3881396.1 hypothetical protein [Eubacteriales bacterium]MDD4513083.1 hypothetical protein [Eubacteriales bacterium]